MDITQILITAGAVVGIILIGIMAIVPTVLEMPDRDELVPVTPLHDRRQAHRHHHDLAA